MYSVNFGFSQQLDNMPAANACNNDAKSINSINNQITNTVSPPYSVNSLFSPKSAYPLYYLPCVSSNIASASTNNNFKPFTKCSTSKVKKINGNEKTYTEYKLQNGTHVLVNNNSEAANTQIRTSLNISKDDLKKTAVNILEERGMPEEKAQNVAETIPHLFEHMLGGNKLQLSENFNKGYHGNVDDYEETSPVSFIAYCDNEISNIIKIINNQAETIYNNEFSENVFDREKEALNIELATDSKKSGNRDHLDSITLGDLIKIRNSILKPENIEIVVEGNVNSDEMINEIAKSKANIKETQIMRLNDTDYPVKCSNKDTPRCSAFEIRIPKPANTTDTENRIPKSDTDTKFQAILEAIRLLALFSDKTDLESNIRHLCYGPQIYIDKKDNTYYTFTYEGESFQNNAAELRGKIIENIKQLKEKKFEENDLNNVKNFIKNGGSGILLNNEKEVLDEIKNITLDELNDVIDQISCDIIEK